MPDEILIAREGAVATATLNRPDKLNAMNAAMWTGLTEAMASLSADDSLRCVILRGAGERAFSAGADIAEFERDRSTVDKARAYGQRVRALLRAIRACRHPVVVMIHGLCVGGGLEIAACCDLRVCGAASRFGIPIKKLGLVVAYAELEGLIQLVGPANALEILLDGRLFGAEEARQMGLVNRVVPDDRVEAETRALADSIAEGAPLVARWHKKFTWRLMEGRPLTPAEADEAYHCFGSEDFVAGSKAFLAKTKPVFQGR